MMKELKLDGFAKFTWFVLAYNIVVILWGVFLRASKSGDGCGQHWLTCHGEIIPSAPELKTVIEFSHRLTSGLAFLVVLGLLIWTFRRFPKGDVLRKLVVGSFIFILTEALVGAGLVLTGNTAEANTFARPFWSAGHLINTFILLAFLASTAWFASTEQKISLKFSTKKVLLLSIGLALIFFTGISGSLAALSSMLFPSETLAEGIAKDFSATSHFLLRLRISHPILSVVTAIYLFVLSLWVINRSPNSFWTKKWAGNLSFLVILQTIFGGLTLVMLAPILMQIGHLFLADSVWIVFILMSICFLSDDSSEIR